MKKVLSSALLTMLAAASTLPASAQTTANPNIKQPEAPFTSINLFEVAEQDSGHFVSDWNKRSAVIAQMPGFITATLYKTMLPDSRYQIVNISQWQSYNAFVDGQNNPTYSSELAADLNQTASIKLTRGFFRPVAYYAHVYD